MPHAAMPLKREQRERVVLRLTDEERETLKLLIAALKVSEYTDDVDGMSSYRRGEKMRRAMDELFTAVVGLTHVSEGLPKDLLSKLADSTYRMRDVEPILANTFEIARRFKRFNPDKIRSEYGKLVMLLQDLHCQPGLGFDFERIVVPVKTVGSALAAINATKMLSDPRLVTATSPLPPRASADAVQAKALARAALMDEYGEPESTAASPVVEGAPARAEGAASPPPVFSPVGPSAAAAAAAAKPRAVIDRCIKSLDDAESFMSINVRSIDVLLGWLNEFRDAGSEPLAIVRGKGGSCLTHSHAQQIGYVREALCLWREIHENIFDFWETVEQDMVLSGAGYRWRNTGQGFHRVSAGPLTYRRMREAIAVTEQRLGGWVGSQVVHLGDDDVPNPLVFIDKYTGIPTYLAPVVQTIHTMTETFCSSEEPYPGIRDLLLGDAKSPEVLKRTILRDLFRHGFDGSGDDGGSCIDGRLTSLWNWCSLLHKKSYYPVFLLTGFNGFDANFN